VSKNMYIRTILNNYHKTATHMYKVVNKWLLISTLATPLRHPCEGGGVEKLALYTNAYRSFWSFAIPNQSEKKLAQHKNKIVI